MAYLHSKPVVNQDEEEELTDGEEELADEEELEEDTEDEE